MTSSAFRGSEAFRPNRDYELLPFRFTRLAGDTYIVTNEVGEYVTVPREDIVRLVRRELEPGSDTYKALKARHFLFDRGTTSALDLLALKYRTRAERAASFTGLHIFVVTLRCDHS